MAQKTALDPALLEELRSALEAVPPVVDGIGMTVSRNNALYKLHQLLTSRRILRKLTA